jgi:hypothetical protein
MSKDNWGTRRGTTRADQALRNLEVIVIGDAFVREDLRPGDPVLVDWGRKPDNGTIGAVRGEGAGVRFIVFDGSASGQTGRLVNPPILLRV